MSVRSVVVAALVVAGVLMPAAAADAPDHLVLTASRSAAVDFVVTATATPTGERPTFTGGGRFAGLVIEALGDRGSGRLNSRVFAAFRLSTVSDDVHMLAIPDRMPPGRYRATVLADRPVEVVVRLSGGGTGAVLRATRPVTTRLATTRSDLSGTPPDGVTSMAARLPAAVPRGHEAVIVARSTGQRADTAKLCVAAAGQKCPSQLLPFALPGPLAGREPDAGGMVLGEGLAARFVEPAVAVRDAVTSLQGVRAGPTVLVLGALSFRRV